MRENLVVGVLCVLLIFLIVWAVRDTGTQDTRRQRYNDLNIESCQKAGDVVI